MNNQKSTFIGFGLLFLLWITYIWFSSPSAERIKWEKEQRQRIQDSIALAKQEDSLALALEIIRKDSLLQLRQKLTEDETLSQEERDSILKSLETKVGDIGDGKAELFGSFAQSASCEEKTYTLENEQLRLSFSSKGGRIVDVQIKGYLGYDLSTADQNDKIDVHLLNHQADQFNYIIPIKDAKGGKLGTQDLCFEPTVKDGEIVFRAYTDDRNQYIEQKYRFAKEGKGYMLDYDFNIKGLGDLIGSGPMQLHWYNHLNKIEKNPEYERRMTSIHYKLQEAGPNYCNCAANADTKLEEEVKWVSHAQQFFNATLIFKGEKKASQAQLTTFMMPKDSAHLKDLYTRLELPLSGDISYEMQLYIGPNKYEDLIALNIGLDKIIPYGWSIFGVIGRYVIRPLFNFFASFVPNYGIVIILLTFLIRLLMFPLQFKMLKSGVKMSILRPQLEALKKKYKDDTQGYQMEQMRVYGEYGVSPLGGCLPMLLTMPIWIALYRFFPASIEFRQKGFLWADDLVSYDSILDFGYIPIVGDFYGEHISLFTLLWTVSMFAYLIYNGKQMDMSGGVDNPQMKMMKTMQYAFPVIFFFALNSWAAGLTCYMLFSNLLNITQTFLVKNVLIDKDKLAAKMEEIRKNPKPKSSFMQRYEEALKQQQEMKRQQQQNKNKKK